MVYEIYKVKNSANHNLYVWIKYGTQSRNIASIKSLLLFSIFIPLQLGGNLKIQNSIELKEAYVFRCLSINFWHINCMGQIIDFFFYFEWIVACTAHKEKSNEELANGQEVGMYDFSTKIIIQCLKTFENHV